MHGLVKSLIGVGATSLLAWGAHSMGGEAYLTGIESEAQSRFAEAGFGDSDALSMARDPMARVAIVEGAFDSSTQDMIRGQLLQVPGVSDVYFAPGDTAGLGLDTDTASEADMGAVAPASEEAVADCQSGVEALMEGKTINFASGSAAISPASTELVDALAGALQDCAGMRVAIGGHTDSTGSAETNNTLSQARADAVAAALSERGLPADRFTATGYGSSQPLIAGEGANAANRRIEFTLSAAGASGEGN
ncbi:OmpA family protein [Erythrobacter sp. W53]|uniref:OmpA family protein n=1 Tax=Erythrobacter sp. W53 TaxID=3425947 RepID=UPI003D7678F6